MTKLVLKNCSIEKWMHQNKADYTGDFVEGCLLDNFVVSTKRGFAAVYEKPVNNSKSTYYIEFQTGSAQDVFRNWYKFVDEAEEQRKEEEERYRLLANRA